MSIEDLREETDYHFKIRVQARAGGIGRARSEVCSWFLKEADSDTLVFVDADIVFKPEAITRLVEAAKDGHEVIGGGYLRADGVAFPIKPWEEKQYQPDGLIHDVEYISTGFLAISRKALEQIRDKLELPLLHEGRVRECYPFFESGRDTTGRHNFYTSEDWDFCDKTRQAGMKTYWHSGALVGHLKRVILVHRQEKWT